MPEARLVLLAIAAYSAPTAVADVLAKEAAEPGCVGPARMVLASIVLGVSACCRHLALKHMNLAAPGGAYSLIAITSWSRPAPICSARG